MAAKPAPRRRYTKRTRYQKDSRISRSSRMLSVKGGSYRAPLLSGFNQTVPSSMNTTLVYCTGLTYTNQTLGGSGNSILIFRGNGMHDPDYQLGGAQPVGFDQLHALYKYHRVIASRCEFIYSPGEHTSTALCALPSTGPTGTWQGFMSQRNAKIDTHWTTSTGSRTYSMYRRTADVTGVDITDEALVGSSTASPTTGWYWCCGINNDTGAGVQYSVVVRITYYCEFFEPVTLAIS